MTIASPKDVLSNPGRAIALSCVILVGILCVLILSADPPGLSASHLDASPTLAAVSPTEAHNLQATSVTITGTNFTAIPTAKLGTVTLANVTFISSTTLTATVPANLPGGTYTLVVMNPDGKSASLRNAFTVLRSGDGGLGCWQATNSMTTDRRQLAAVQVGQHIYAVGGHATSYTPLSSVERARIKTDGTLGPWQAATSMTTGRRGHAAVHANGYLYALGGGDSGPDSVERAAVNSDGTLGTWQAVASMTAARVAPAAVVANDHIYALGGGMQWGFYTNSVERAKINADGSLTSWQTTSSMNMPRQTLAAVVVGNYIYAIGGQNTDSASLHSVERAAIRGDGSLGAWKAMSSMTTPRCDLAAVTVGGYIYAIGGGNCQGTVYDSVERARVNPDGSLSPWEAVTSMTAVRIFPAAVHGAHHIYAIGGRESDHTMPGSVERAQILDDVPPTGPGLSINDGALFTNKVKVTLTIGAQLGTPQMQVSNDGGFAGAEWEPYASHKIWRITQYGAYVIPRVVYVRYKDCQGNISATYQDDIILDVTAPTGSVEVMPSAPANQIWQSTTSGGPPHRYKDKLSNTDQIRVTLQLSAQDDVSGVADMIISNDESFESSNWEPYTTTRTWFVPSEGSTTVHVRFRDHAGNASDVVTDTFRQKSSVYVPLVLRGTP